MLLDIRPDHLEWVKTILQRWVPDLEVWVFGSRAKWTAKDTSDLDLCIMTSQPLRFEVMGHLQEAFSDSDLPYKVDVVDWSSVSKAFQAVIERDKVVMQSSSANGQSGRGVSSEWRSVRLEEVTSILGDGLHGTPAYDDGGDYHFINGSNLSNGEIVITDATKRLSFSEFNRHKKKLGDRTILVSINGTLGNVALYRGEKVVLGKSACYFNVLNSVDKHFVRYVVASELFQSYISNLATGSTIKNVSLRLMRDFPFTLPPLDVQQRIAGILKALDDRITLLRETNATLEAIAQALFKSWFVDFDPVRAKMEGRAPEGMDEATAALFPDGFEKSALGLVPRGWRVMPIGDAVEAVGGATPDTKTPAFWEPAIHCWTTPKDLSGIPAPVLLDTDRKLSDLGLAKIGSGLLPVGTLLLSSRAPIGYLALAQVPLAINQGYIAMPPGGMLPPLYMLFWCRQNMENIKGRANGSTFMEISKTAFRPIPTLVPSAEVVQVFVDTASALFERLIENEKQAQTLATLRDTLLPRLISGQLRLPEADAILENA